MKKLGYLVIAAVVLMVPMSFVVRPAFAATIFDVLSSVGSNVFQITHGSNVGIAIATRAEKWEVIGDVKVSDSVAGSSFTSGKKGTTTPSANTHSIDLESNSSQYLSIADGSQTGLDITGDMTIEAWLKLESPPSTNTNYTIVAKYDTDTNNRSYRFLYGDASGTKKIIWQFSDDGTGGDHVSTAEWNITLNTAQWYHVAVAYDNAGSAILYVNGVSQGAVSSLLTNIHSGSATFAVGAVVQDSNVEFFDGLIDEVRIWNVTRTGAQIADGMNLELNAESAWHLNNNLQDSSANGNILTNNASSTFSTDVPFNSTNTKTKKPPCGEF